MASDRRTDTARPETLSGVDRSLPVVLAERLAATKGCDPEALPPLYQSVDPDSLERLVTMGDESGLMHVSFSHAGCQVTVDTDGVVTVTE